MKKGIIAAIGICLALAGAGVASADDILRQMLLHIMARPKLFPLQAMWSFTPTRGPLSPARAGNIASKTAVPIWKAASTM